MVIDLSDPVIREGDFDDIPGYEDFASPKSANPQPRTEAHRQMSGQDIPEEDFFGPEPANTIPKYEGIIRSPDDSSNVNADPENSI